MKLYSNTFDSNFSKIKSLLVYGADAGQVDEYSKRCAKNLSIERDNIFTISAKDFKEKSDFIFAEACSPSMFGGDKLIVINDAGDSDTKQILELINNPSRISFVVVLGGELKSTGSMRKSFEDDASLGCLACYLDDVKTLPMLIQNDLFASGITRIMPDAMNYMVQNFGSDRGITRSFLQKIAIYCGDKKVVELDDAVKCLPDTGAANLDEFLYAMTSGEIANSMRAMDRLFFDGYEPIAMCRMMAMHFDRLFDAVVNGKMPRIFNPSLSNKFSSAIKFWTVNDITEMLSMINTLEDNMKTTGMPAEIMMRDCALKISARGYKLSSRTRNR